MNKETLQDIADRYEQNDKETMRLSRAGGKMSELTPQERARTIVLWANGNPGYITTYDGRKALEEQIASVIIDAEAAAIERAAQGAEYFRLIKSGVVKSIENGSDDDGDEWVLTWWDDNADEWAVSHPSLETLMEEWGKFAREEQTYEQMKNALAAIRALSPESTARSKQDDLYAPSKTSARTVIQQDGRK